MQPIAPLMIEHRLMDRMIELMKNEVSGINERKKTNPEFIEVVIDFFTAYVDDLHHGKEEDILFHSLEDRGISAEHRKIMDELIEEHVYARKIIGRLRDAHRRYLCNEKNAIEDVGTCLQEMIEFYPAHIQKEDGNFFLPSMDYFSKEEQDNMLEEMEEFDKHLFQRKYEGIVRTLERE